MYSATFDGTSGSRNIRLGGRRDDREDRRETLERARRERKQRQVLRQQQAAARTMQAAVRAATDLHRVRCAHRVAWDKKMHDIAALRPILLATTNQRLVMTIPLVPFPVVRSPARVWGCTGALKTFPHCEGALVHHSSSEPVPP